MIYRFLMRCLGVLLLLVIGVGFYLWLGPRQKADLSILKASFVADDADAVNVFLSGEAAFDDIRPGQEKQILWAGAEGQKTAFAVLYIHGFSASLQEIRPVPDKVAAALGANLVFTRLAGHARPGRAMADVHVNDWLADLSQAISAAKAVGKRVIVIATSTGGTLLHTGLSEPSIANAVSAIVYVSPNFGVASQAAQMANLPGFVTWGPMIAGYERSWTPENDQQAQFWTTRYPTVSILPMMALITAAKQVQAPAIQVPALFMYSDTDKVVDPTETDQILALWGGPKQRWAPNLSERDAPYGHVIMGDILSAGQTEPATRAILDWVSTL